MTDDSRQRIDKWLWFARVVKTRALAQDLATSGHVRLNGRKIDAASQAVKVGDVLTIGVHGRVRVLRVEAFAARRGSYPDALRLFTDLSPAPEGTAPADPDDDPTAYAGAEPDGDRGDPAPAAAVPPQRPAAPTGAPRAVRGEGRPTKRDRRRMDAGSSGEPG